MESLALESTLVAALGNLLLGLAVFLRRPGSRVHQAFGLLSLAIAAWNAADFGYLLFLSLNGVPSPAWHRAIFVGSMAIQPAAFWLVRSLAGRGRDWTWSYGWALLGQYLVLIALLATPLFPRTYLVLAAGYQFSNLCLALALLVARMRAAGEVERRGIKYLVLGGVAATLLGATDYLASRLEGVPRLGAPAILLYLCLVSAAIGRHGLFSAARMFGRWIWILIVAFAFAALVQGVQLLAPRGTVSGWLAPLLVAVLAVALYDPIRESLRIYRSRFRSASEDLAERITAVGRKLAFLHDPSGWQEVLLPGLRCLDGMEAAEFLPAASLPGGDWDAQSASIRRAGRFNILVPVHDSEKLHGALALRIVDPHLRLEPEHLDILTLLGAQAGLLIQGAERLRWMKRQEELEALAEMATGAAHEIRNPLAAMRGALDLLIEKPSDHPERFIRIVREEVDRLDRFLADFMAYGRPAALDRTRVDLAALARETAEVVALRQGSPAVAVRGDREAPVDGDRLRLRQVILNLLLNAAEAAGPSGRVEVRVEGGPRETTIRVLDDGPGIAPDVLPRLFRPFFTTRAGGTGLGLAICARIVDLHGGSIEAGNRRGPGERGAEFRVRLPIL